MVMSHMIRIFDDIIVLETTVNSHWLVTVPTCLNNAAMPIKHASKQLEHLRSSTVIHQSLPMHQ